MFGSTPSGRRRSGREAYSPGVDPMDVQPYAKGSWSYLEDWFDGWNEAQQNYKDDNEPERCPHRGQIIKGVLKKC